MGISRRRFLMGVAGSGAAAVIPAAALDRVVASVAAPDSWYFLAGQRIATCQAICARLVPTGVDPVAEPGAAEARAAVFIDRFLAAFELPATLADAPAIWVRGRYSGRNAYPDPATGEPSASYPPDEMLGHFVPLSRVQALSWKAQLYGPAVLLGAAAAEPALGPWARQVAAGMIPGAAGGGFRGRYAAGLDAFDAWSRRTFLRSFASATAAEQDVMLAVAGNVVLDGIGPSLPTLPVLPPAAAEELFPVILSDTFAACYGLPEYRWQQANPLWPEIGYDGDTVPLGNSVYDADLPETGQNEGFGAPGVYEPSGGYREYRPVSQPYPAGSGELLGAAQLDRFLGPLIARRGQR